MEAKNEARDMTFLNDKNFIAGIASPRAPYGGAPARRGRKDELFVDCRGRMGAITMGL